MRWWKITWWVGGGGGFKCSGKASLRFYIWTKNLNHKKLLSLWRSGRRLSKQKEQQGQLPSVRNELGTYENQKQGRCAWSLRTGGRCGSEQGWRGRQGFQIMKGLVDHGNNLGCYSEHSRKPWRALRRRTLWCKRVSSGCDRESGLWGTEWKLGDQLVSYCHGSPRSWCVMV